jgi:2-C-methyl-D-erythritol 4-phosphate cytidylyltransferase/2-C-methyl-D-erythritol 2,4-cyclodiphosphate synthase
MKTVALLLSAGHGSRFGAARPKQFLPLLGRPVLRHAAEALLAEGLVATLQPVAPAGEEAYVAALLEGLPCLPVVAGGATREDSVRAGLEAIAAEAPDYVLVHDAARPVIPRGTIPALLTALKAQAGAIPAQPVADTLKRVADGVIEATVPREGLFRAQTPQAFRFEALRAAHAARAGAVTDDASLLEVLGQAVAIVPGSERNVKITWPEDLARVEAEMMARMSLALMGIQMRMSGCMRCVTRFMGRWRKAISGAGFRHPRLIGRMPIARLSCAMRQAASRRAAACWCMWM